MTIRQVIEQVDLLTANQIPMEQKVMWLSDLDGRVAGEVYAGRETVRDIPFSGYDADTDLETGLLIQAPYDEVYRWWLEMKIQDVNGEIVRYNNAAQKYNLAMQDFMNYVTRTYPPVKRCRLTF